MSNQQTNNPGGACGCISLICSVVFVLCLFTPPLFGFMVISSGLLWIIAIVSDQVSSRNIESSPQPSTSQMQNQANTTSSSSPATVDRHGISWIEEPTSTTLSSSQTSNPIVDNNLSLCSLSTRLS